jgi:CelD/BcsL family acetyltransferase involved in cellulose biosynthesis
MKNFIEKIIENKTSCYFISPSFGDAAASAGELMAELAGKVDITVINIFTKAEEGKHTLSAKQFLKHSKAANAHELYENRILEDTNALALFPAKVVHLDFSDALWRKKDKKNALGKHIPEFHSLYPTYKHIMSGNIAKEDEAVKEALEKKLHEVIPTHDENFFVFCPMGFFAHIDYLLLRDLCQQIFQKRCIFYTLPINDLHDKAKNDFVKNNHLEQHAFTNSSEKKYMVLKAYGSQADQFLDDTALTFQPEIYYFPITKEGSETIHKTTTIHTELNETLVQEWQELWEKSSLKNFFNAPLWFQSCLKTFEYPEIRIITHYENTKLVAILPVVLTKQYGIAVYATPGNQYYDNSSLLLTEYDPEVIQALLHTLSEAGNFYLSELGQPVANICSTFMKNVGIAASSISPYFSLHGDPEAFITKKNKRILAKRFKDGEGHISCNLYLDDIEKHLQTLIAIDNDSSKQVELKATFSDPLLLKLLLTINDLQEKKIVIALLFYKDEPICYNYGFLYNKTFIGTGTAYKREYNRFSPGRLLVRNFLPQLGEMGIVHFDFSRGVSRFKKDFSPYAYHQYAVFYSANPLVMRRWRLLNKVKNYLETHPALFEFARKTKKKIIH